ncbi:MAG: hypothetical protein COB14_04335 [Alphaproteobacteria bacterium]|nr:MAG: hypothetical protein COB14_04335 [Alphaproteobacteria bacterium]
MPQQEQEFEESVVLSQGACDDCGSSDALTEYSDGHTYCFSCGTPRKGDGEASTAPSKRASNLFNAGEYEPLRGRGLSEETCRKFKYRTGMVNGVKQHIADVYSSSGDIVAQQLRDSKKNFKWFGNQKEAALFGQQLWKAGGKRLVITEGFLDAMSLSQVQSHKWPVVSIIHGCEGAVKDIKANLEWIESFQEVIFLFDNDADKDVNVGYEAAKKCLEVLSIGKGKIAQLPLKDANEMLKANRIKELTDACWNAKEYRPDGIVAGSDLFDLVQEELKPCDADYPWAGLNVKTLGLRINEITTICAGSGIGKTTACKEIEHSLIKQGETIGIIHLEESLKKTALAMMSIELEKPLHLQSMDTSSDEFRKAFDATIGSGLCYLYDHFGSMDSDNLLNKIRYMVVGLGCKWVVLDHISILVSGIGDGDERRIIDNMMTKLRSLVEELPFGLILVSHLKRPKDKGHEDGAITSLAQLRGSASIAQLSDIVIGLERNQQDPENKNMTILRILKNRYSGDTGLAHGLVYSKETGRMSEIPLPTSESAFQDESGGGSDGDY